MSRKAATGEECQVSKNKHENIELVWIKISTDLIELKSNQANDIAVWN